MGSEWESERERRREGEMAGYTQCIKEGRGEVVVVGCQGHASQTSEAGRSVAQEKVRQRGVQQTSE